MRQVTIVVLLNMRNWEQMLKTDDGFGISLAKVGGTNVRMRAHTVKG